MHSNSEFLITYKGFVRDFCIPHMLRRNNAKEEDSKDVKDINYEYVITYKYTEPHQPQQNPAEWEAVRYLKKKTQQLMNISNVPDKCWHLCMQYGADNPNHVANRRNHYKVLLEVATGNTVDILHILKFIWFQPVYYHDPSSSYPESTENQDILFGLQIVQEMHLPSKY